MSWLSTQGYFSFCFVLLRGYFSSAFCLPYKIKPVMNFVKDSWFHRSPNTDRIIIIFLIVQFFFFTIAYKTLTEALIKK